MSLLLKSVLERRVEKERDRHPHGTGEGGVGESEEHTDVSLVPREAQEWRVPTEAARSRLDLRGVLRGDQLLPRGPPSLLSPGTAWTTCPQQASGLARISSTPPLLHTASHPQSRGEWWRSPSWSPF